MSPAPGTQIRQAYVTADTPIVTTNETIAVTLTGVSTDGADKRVELHGELTLTSGAGTTGVTVSVRRGSTAAGALVGESVLSAVAAGANVTVPIDVQDTPGEVAGQSYVLTVLQGGATGNGSIGSASLTAEILGG